MATNLKKNGLQMKILETAVKMFNEEGYSSVSIRDISKKLNISPGNLTYYYKKKNDLIKAIFDLQYIEYKNMNIVPCSDIEGLSIIFQNIIKHQNKYAFYFNNIIEIPRLYPELSDIQIKVFKEFKDLFKYSLLNLNKEGIVRSELMQDAYDDLAFALLSAALFWNQQNVYNEKFSKKNIVHMLWNILLPNFTQKGLDLYHLLKAK